MSLVNLAETATELKRLNDISSYKQLFCVYEIEFLAANEDGRFSGHHKTEEVWFLEDGTEDPYEEQEGRFQALDELSDCDDRITVNDNEYVKLTVLVVPRFVTACLTHEAAVDYIERSKHKLNRPYVETTNLKRNAEMLGVRNFITDTF